MRRKKKTSAPDVDLEVRSFRSPESSNIAGAVYTPALRELVIEFKPKAEGQPVRKYHYSGIPEALWDEFADEALSKGKFFANCIKPFYACSQVS